MSGSGFNYTRSYLNIKCGKGIYVGSGKSKISTESSIESF